MSDRYVVEVVNGEDRYVAYGLDPEHLRMYRRETNDYHRRTNIWFPSCTKFMPYAWVGERVKMTVEAIEKKYGERLGMYEEQSFESESS